MDNIPKHIAIIMDGNGRWAEERGLPRIAGHKAGVEAVRRTLVAAQNMGVRYLTLYSFSTENWKRPKEEVAFLLRLMEGQFRAEAEDLNRNNVRVRVIGERAVVPEGLRSAMNDVERLTKGNDGITLVFAINYGGRAEILSAINRILAGPRKKKITEEAFRSYLYAPDIPDPDLFIRTAGEQRLSNFLLWQSSYAEYCFTKVLWPDFTAVHLRKAVADFEHRRRKFGGLISGKRNSAKGSRK